MISNSYSELYKHLMYLYYLVLPLVWRFSPLFKTT
nr:MAG TPA: hypothetical protein [Caudoviricetes sp.]